MDAAADDDASFGDGLQSERHKIPNRSEDDCGIEFCWRQFVRTASPNRTEFDCKLLRFLVPRTREGVDLALLITRDLRDDVRCRAESVNT